MQKIAVHQNHNDKTKHNPYSRKGVYNHLYLDKNTRIDDDQSPPKKKDQKKNLYSFLLKKE